MSRFLAQRPLTSSSGISAWSHLMPKECHWREEARDELGETAPRRCYPESHTMRNVLSWHSCPDGSAVCCPAQAHATAQRKRLLAVSAANWQVRRLPVTGGGLRLQEYYKQLTAAACAAPQESSIPPFFAPLHRAGLPVQNYTTWEGMTHTSRGAGKIGGTWQPSQHPRHNDQWFLVKRSGKWVCLRSEEWHSLAAPHAALCCGRALQSQLQEDSGLSAMFVQQCLREAHKAVRPLCASTSLWTSHLEGGEKRQKGAENERESSDAGCFHDAVARERHSFGTPSKTCNSQSMISWVVLLHETVMFAVAWVFGLAGRPSQWSSLPWLFCLDLIKWWLQMQFALDGLWLVRCHHHPLDSGRGPMSSRRDCHSFFWSVLGSIGGRRCRLRGEPRLGLRWAKELLALLLMMSNTCGVSEPCFHLAVARNQAVCLLASFVRTPATEDLQKFPACMRAH